MKKLSEFCEGQRGVVAVVGGTPSTVQRLTSLGIYEGIFLEVKKRAPLGDPIWIVAEHQEISLRKAEAEAIDMQEETAA